MKKRVIKETIPGFLSQPIILALLTSVSLAFLIILASWGFYLRSIVKWFLQSSLLAIPICVLLYFFYFRKKNISIVVDIPVIIVGMITAVLIVSELIPPQIKPTHTIVVYTATTFLILILFMSFTLIFLSNKSIPWKKIVVWVFFLSGLIGVGLILRVSLFARLYSDDFCYAVDFDRLGFPDAALFFYKDWSGRIFTNFFVMGLTDQPYTIIYLICLTVASILISVFLITKGESKNERWFYSLAVSLFSFLAISIAAPDFYKSFFWICSALILFPAFIMIPVDLAGAFQFIRKPSKQPITSVLFSALISFFIATSHEVAAMGWLALNAAALLWVLIFNKKNKNLKYFLIVAVLATLIGIGVLLASPGIKNRSQVQQYPGSTPILHTIPILFKNFFETIKNIANPYYRFEGNGRPGWFLLLGVMGMGYLGDFHIIRKFGSVLAVIAITALTIFATSFPAAYVYRGNIPLRTQMIPVFFLTLGAFITGMVMPRPNKILIINAVLLFVIISVLLGMRIVIPRMLSIIAPLQQYANDWDARDQKYINSTEIPPRIDIPWDEYEQNIDCIELYYAHLTELSQSEN